MCCQVGVQPWQRTRSLPRRPGQRNRRTHLHLLSRSISPVLPNFQGQEVRVSRVTSVASPYTAVKECQRSRVARRDSSAARAHDSGKHASFLSTFSISYPTFSISYPTFSILSYPTFSILSYPTFSISYPTFSNSIQIQFSIVIITFVKCMTTILYTVQIAILQHEIRIASFQRT